MYKLHAITLCCLLTACSGVSDFGSQITHYVPGYPANELKSIGLFVPSDQSHNRAIQLDVIFIYSKDAQITFSNIDATQWFIQKPAFLARFAQLRISGSSDHPFRYEPTKRFGIIRPPISV